MSRTATTPIVLPFGSKPGWELESGEEIGKEDKRSILESCVLFHALRQSREKWLHSTFPRFSSKVRGGKATEPAPPPHTIQTRGKCDLEIGPHIFSDTTFYEVHYLPSQPSSITGLTHQSSTTGSWQTKTPYTRIAPANTTKSLESDKSSAPLASNLTSVATITPALINQVNIAASSNPTLANLLQLAAAGLATSDQLKTLGLLIQSLATSESTQPVPPPSVATPSLPPLPPVTPTPVKEFDLVLEFCENPNERWIFPRGPVTCERITNLPGASPLSRTVLKACLPFSTLVASEVSPVPGEVPSTSPTVGEPQVITFTLERTPLAVWDTISRWSGNQENLQQNKIKLDVMKPAEHVYLGYQLSEGPLLSQLQTASAPTYTMKSLKVVAATATRAKRKVANKVKERISQNPQDIGSADKPHPMKRKKSSHQFERPPAPPIQCVSCKSQDVPLILGGRFCRPCVEAGHATATTQPSQYKFSSYIASSTPLPLLTSETTPSLDTPK